MGSGPYGLRVEHLDEPLGIHVTSPRLSWRLPPGSDHQIGYRVRTDNGWDTGRVDSDASILISYDGPLLRSRQRVGWQVKVWTDLGESDWSHAASFELGLLHPQDWRASWIRPAEEHGRPGGRSAPRS